MVCYKCTLCCHFISQTLRMLMKHHRESHANDINYAVVCGVAGCPARFTKMTSFYKHIRRNHDDEYNLGNDNSSAPVQPEYARNDEEIHETVDDNLINPETVLETHDNYNEYDGDNSEHSYDNMSDRSQSQSDHIENDQTYVPDIKKNAAMFLLKTKEQNKLSQVALENVMDGTRSLIQQVLSSILKQCSEHPEMLSGLIDDDFDPFHGLETEALQSKFIKERLFFVEFREINFGPKLRMKRKACSTENSTIIQDYDKFIYIPIVDSIEQLLQNGRVRKELLKCPTKASEGVFCDIQDGSIYRNDSYFIDHPDALMILIYHDELEICNALGSYAGKNKLDMFYYAIGNIDTKYRSKRCAVRLLAIANASLVKQYGINKVLSPIVKDLNTLYAGVSIDFDGKRKTIYGKVIMCCGDTLGQNYWGGFKEGVSFAYQKCRHCFCTAEKLQNDFKEDLFTARTKKDYESQFESLENAGPRAKDNLRMIYGISEKSMLAELQGFDVTAQLPQDIMHTLLEGVNQYEMRLVIHNFMKRGLFDLEKLNAAIANHPYGYSEVSNKPGFLRTSVFNGTEKYKLKLKAAQARMLMQMLPFILTPFVDINDSYYIFIMELLEIQHWVFAPVINVTSVENLKDLITKHLVKFKELFPDSNLLPKQHYMLHLPTIIKKLGPMCHSSCFKFESAHCYFKQIAKNQSFKNIVKSLAKRNQFKDCCDDSGGNPEHPLFSSERRIGNIDIVDQFNCDRLRQRFDLAGLLPFVNFNQVYRTSWIMVHGTKYANGAVVAHGVKQETQLPLFGVIKSIYLVHDFVYIECENLSTKNFSFTYQSYEVDSYVGLNVITLCPLEALVDHHVLHLKTGNDNKSYIPMRYCLKDAISEYLQANVL